MSVIGSNILAGASGQGGYFLTNSLRFRSSASAYLNRTPASAGNRRTWTYSAWVKRGSLGSDKTIFAAYSTSSDSGQLYVTFQSGDKIAVGWFNGEHATTAVFRDPSAYYHIVVVVDTTQATALNRTKVYVNGVAQTMTVSVGTSIPQNTDTAWNNNVSQTIGSHQPYTGWYFDGYQTEINAIDGQALTPSSFGETSTTTGVWIPKKYTGTYGTNGFYLPFTDNSALTTSSNVGLGKDFSGNANYWTTNNISITAGTTYDSMTDVPTLTSATAANYCVMSPIASSPLISLTNGNLTAGGTDEASLIGTIGVNSGKWYWEVTVTSGSVTPYLGVSSNSFDKSGVGTNYVLAGISWYGNGLKKAYTGTSSTSATSNTTGVYGFALDISAGTLAYYFNNSLVFTDTTIPTSGVTLFPLNVHTNSGSNSWNPANFNFGQQPFAYTPPTGFVRLNTFNLPTPTIGATASTLANEYFDALLYTGNGSASQRTDISWANMQPDMVWIKNRTSANNHVLHDDVRGTNAALQPNLTNATDSPVGFGTDGFGFDGVANQLRIFTSDGRYNTNGNAYVTWGWKGSGATGVTNTAGSITSTVSANTTAGFSIVTYTGTGSNATVGHGLGVAPSMVIVKSRTNAYDWVVYNSNIGNTNKLYLNLNSGSVSDSTAWNNTSPTSTVFSLGSNVGVNQSSSNHVAYCFAQVAGYSAFGSYTGNGSSDGPFIFTGFRPKFVMFKGSSIASNWCMLDSSRNTYNLTDATLQANSSAAELTNLSDVDFLSNGIKIRDVVTNDTNVSGQTYIYMAFAENPFKYANAR
jgi:hypothetical protein